MLKMLRFKYILPEVHALLFICMWSLFHFLSEPLLNGPTGFLFLILFLVDLPISLIAFGVMFTSARLGLIAAVAWGVLGTMWCCAIGFMIDRSGRIYRSKRVTLGPSSSDTSGRAEAKGSWLKELTIAISVAAVLVASSVIWKWQGPKGDYERGEIGNFAVAPDGNSLLYARWYGDSSRVERLNLDSDASTPVGNKLPCLASGLTFSPDQKWIAFDCWDRGSDKSQIMIMDSEGGDARSLVPSDTGGENFGPHFSPDGREVYFSRRVSTTEEQKNGKTPERDWSFYSVSIEAKDEHLLADEQFKTARLVFSPESNTFVLTQDSVSGTRVQNYQIPGAVGWAIVSSPNLSADGRSIYFMGASNEKKGFDYDVFRFDLVNNTVEKLTSENGYATDLVISDDGHTAFYLRWTPRWGSFPDLIRLYRLDLATKSAEPLNVTGSM